MKVSTTRTGPIVLPEAFAALPPAREVSPRIVQSNDDLASRAPGFHMSDSLTDLTKWVSLVDDRRYFSGLHEIGQERQVLFVHVGQHHLHLLAYERFHQQRFDDQTERTDPPVVVYSTAPDQDVFAVGI